MILYPSTEDIIQLNDELLRLIGVKKTDRHRVLGRGGIDMSIRAAKYEEGDCYDKAAILVLNLVKGHYFDSANRRTAFEVGRAFLKLNGEEVRRLEKPETVLLRIREGFYGKNEIKEWLKGYGIRPLKR